MGLHCTQHAEMSGLYAKMRDGIVGKPEEEKNAMEKLEDQLEENCPSLTWTQRLIGFVLCCGVGMLLTLGSFFRFSKCLSGDCSSFAIIYSVGNLIAIAATFFLTGPVKQFNPSAPLAICIILSCTLQLGAYIWYSISYIPFARTCVKNALKGFCGGGG